MNARKLLVKWTLTLVLCVVVVALIGFAMLRFQAANERAARIDRGVILSTD